jgi:hypothetical protein
MACRPGPLERAGIYWPTTTATQAPPAAHSDGWRQLHGIATGAPFAESLTRRLPTVLGDRVRLMYSRIQVRHSVYGAYAP